MSIFVSTTVFWGYSKNSILTVVLVDGVVVDVDGVVVDVDGVVVDVDGV